MPLGKPRLGLRLRGDDGGWLGGSEHVIKLTDMTLRVEFDVRGLDHAAHFFSVFGHQIRYLLGGH
jgi:hypothetical protein